MSVVFNLKLEYFIHLCLSPTYERLKKTARRNAPTMTEVDSFGDGDIFNICTSLPSVCGGFGKRWRDNVVTSRVKVALSIIFCHFHVDNKKGCSTYVWTKNVLTVLTQCTNTAFRCPIYFKITVIALR